MSRLTVEEVSLRAQHEIAARWTVLVHDIVLGLRRRYTTTQYVEDRPLGVPF